MKTDYLNVYPQPVDAHVRKLREAKKLTYVYLKYQVLQQIPAPSLSPGMMAC
jgi:hypothetical protein